MLAVKIFRFFYFSGGTPYANMAQSSIVSQIVRGYRLPTPEYASEEMWVLSQSCAPVLSYNATLNCTGTCVLATLYRYKLMLSCWCSEPQARLNFTQLKYSFKSLIFAANAGNNSYVTVQPTPCCAPAIVPLWMCHWVAVPWEWVRNPLMKGSQRRTCNVNLIYLHIKVMYDTGIHCNEQHLPLEPLWLTFTFFRLQTLGDEFVNHIYT